MRTASDDTRVGDDSRRVGAVLLAHDAWAWASLDGCPVLAWSLDALRALPQLAEVALVARVDHCAVADAVLAELPTTVRRTVVPLGADTCGFIAALQAGMGALSSEVEAVLLCDMAAPLMRVATVRAVLAAVQPGCLVATTEPVKDTVKIIRDARITGTIPRERLVTAHAPLAATHADLTALLTMWAHAPEQETSALTSLAMLALRAENLGLRMVAVPGGGDTLRVASADDLAVARGLLAARRETRDARREMA